MYKMYNQNRIRKMILLLTSLFLLFEGFGIALPLIIKQRWSAKNMVLFGGAIIIGLFLLKTALFRNEKSYYSSIQQLKTENPSLVYQYEKEFETAEKICENIWISHSFCYIRTITELKIITFSQLKKIILYRTYSRTACLDLDLITDNERITVTSYIGMKNKENAILCAEKLASISSASLELNLS